MEGKTTSYIPQAESSTPRLPMVPWRADLERLLQCFYKIADLEVRPCAARGDAVYERMERYHDAHSTLRLATYRVPSAASNRDVTALVECSTYETGCIVPLSRISSVR